MEPQANLPVVATSTKSKTRTKVIVGLAIVAVAAAFAIFYTVRFAVGDGIATPQPGAVALPGDIGLVK